MPATFTPAPIPVLDMLQSVLADCYPELAESGATFMVQMVVAGINEKTGDVSGPPLKRGGYPVPATIRIVPLDKRSEPAKLPDVDMKIDGDKWGTFTEAEQRGVIDWCLMRLELVIEDEEKGNVVLRDDAGRPRMKLRKADFVIDGFDATVARNGANAPEVKAAKELVERMHTLGLA